MKRALQIIVATILISLAAYVFLKFEPTEKPELPPVGSKILADLTQAKIENFFPNQIDSLSLIKIATHAKDETVKTALHKNVILPFAENKEGKYSLQIDVIENFDPIEEAQIILQFNLFENQSQNKIWESSRLYKVTPEEVQNLKK